MLKFPTQFGSPQASHDHALETLNELFEYDDFMMSIDSVVDMGCGSEGKDLEWWATRETRDEVPEPLNIDCLGVDLVPELSVAKHHPNISYQRQDFERPLKGDRKFDIVWCHNSFQYAISPMDTLSNFWGALNPGGMLALIVPQFANVVYNKMEYEQPDGVYHNYTLVSLIHMLAVTGFDCKAGFFLKDLEDPWLHAVVYKADDVRMGNPRTLRWYDLLDMGLLPDSAEESIKKCGHVRQRDLVLPWLNKSFIDYSMQ